MLRTYVSPWIAKSGRVRVEFSCSTRVTLNSTFVAKAIVSQWTGWYSILSGDEGLHSGRLCVLLAFCYTQYMRTQLEQRSLVILIPIEHQGAPTYCFQALYLPLQYLSTYSPLSSLYCSNRSESSLSSSLVQMWRVTSLFLHTYIHTYVGEKHHVQHMSHHMIHFIPPISEFIAIISYF